MNCQYCQKEVKNNNSKAQHELYCKSNPNALPKKPSMGMLGKTNPNSGFRGKFSQKALEALRIAGLNQTWSEERRNAQSVAMRKIAHNKGLSLRNPLTDLEKRAPVSVSLICKTCTNEFTIPETVFLRSKKLGVELVYCPDPQCHVEIVACAFCTKTVPKRPSTVKSSTTGNFFCDHTCATFHRNLHREYGMARSALELWLEKALLAFFPSLTFVFNDRTRLIRGLEIDIYLPDVKLGFDIDGILHHKPIYGELTLQKTQERDFAKLADSLTKGITLHKIPVLTNFNPKKDVVILDLIRNEIVRATGLEPVTTRL